jgi:hypothetical protein
VLRGILAVVGVLFFLLAIGPLFVVIPAEDDHEDPVCGAPSVVVALGVDAADPGYEESCRKLARRAVAFSIMVTLLGVLLMWPWWRWRDDEVIEALPPLGPPNGIEPSPRAPPTDALPGVSASSSLVPVEPVDLYLSPRRAVVLLMLVPFVIFLPPLMWVGVRAGRLGLQRRPALTLDDTGLTDHRFGIVVPWNFVHGITLVDATLGLFVEVGDFRPRPGWRPGGVMRWLALQLFRTRRELRLTVRGLEGVEAFANEAARRSRRGAPYRRRSRPIATGF